ncbi:MULTISPECIES: hypothetical protein [Gordonia]|jgi:Mce-associated membrane protein|uniref:hypothetical protein n=1 Tax=Gordonia TaxID=2053 RepID=UPI0025C25AA7|nr:hypothetical protein [Gordonia sp. UBA5067]
MATDDEPDDSVSEPASTSQDEQHRPTVDDGAEARRAKKSAAPVRVAPLRRRPKVKPRSDQASPTAETGPPLAADEATADEATAKPAKAASFVTVDRADPRTTLKWLATTAVAVVLVVASVLLAVGAHRLQQRQDLRAEYDSFAQQVTVNLTSLNKSNVDDIRKTLLDKTSGTAYENLEMVTQQIISQIEQFGIQTQGRVLSSAVTLADPDYGKVLMVLGWTQRIGNGAGDIESQVFRWRVEIRRINGALKLTKFDWVY